MLRMLCAFLAVFSVLSLVVHLNELTAAFAVAAALLFILDLALPHLVKGSRPVRLREPLL